jgi:outer membrane protein W
LNLFVAGSAYTKNNFVIGFPQSITPLEGSFSFSEAIRGGIRTNVYTRGHWGQEFFYSFEPNDVVLRRRTTPESVLKLDTQIHNFGVNALYYIKEDASRVRPFLSAGIGATIYKPTAEARQVANDPFQGNLQDLDTSREIAFNYGAGVSNQLSNTFGIRVDIRGFVGRNPSFGFARESTDPNAIVLPATGAIHNLEISAGMVFFFNRR